MKNRIPHRLLALVLTLAILLALVPVTVSVDAEAAISGLNNLTCSGFISNTISQRYIDTMMRYYINTYSSLQSSLTSGKSVVFMFEGGSDNYWNGSTYYNGVGDVRNQAVCIVVKLNSSGNPYIAYYCENCSSIPDDPKNCINGVAYNGATTVKDGIYSFYTWNHTGPYGAFQLNLGEGYYTPSANPNGYTAGASGLNIHTRSTNTCGGAAAGWNWSLGCQVIGSGYYTGNEFNEFMKVVAGISYNVWLDYYNKSFNTISTGTTKGHYVVDRQLGKMDISGNQFGSGSLINLYNQTALNNITSFSTNARNNAGFSMAYKDRCEFFPSHCTLNVTGADTEVRGAPCSAGTDPASTLIETLQPGKKVTAVGIYKNHYGNYWYEVLTSSGGLGYIYSGNVAYVDDILSDIKLTGATAPNGHVQGTAFYVNGTISSKYNQLTAVACYVHKGFSLSGEKVTGTTVSYNGYSYSLKGSAVDDGTWMSDPAVGNYTYALYASYINYYATSPTTLKSNTGTLTLMDEYYAVIPSAANQSTCSHSITTHVLQASTCQSNGSALEVCSKCGKITEKVTSGGHSYGGWTITAQPTCTEVGTQSRTCSKCGDVDYQSIPAAGHSYTAVDYPATCLEYARTEYTCDLCRHQHVVYANELRTEWSEIYPEGIDPSLIEIKTQYRYSDYETKTSYETALSGFTVKSSAWIQSGTKSVLYVKNWSTGFNTSNSLYSQYNKQSSKVTASTTDTTKTEINSDKLVGYIWYHWCAGGAYSTQTKQGSYTNFHAFFTDRLTPGDADGYDSSDGSYKHNDSTACSGCVWYWPIEVYEQKSTSYKKQFTYERWTDWSAWSDTVYSPSTTRKVETRTLYRYMDAQLGDHAWEQGVCGICGQTCEHTFREEICTNCGMAEDITRYYLVGYINGKPYGCDEDYANLGELKFKDGQLVVTFDSDSYVAVKTEDNALWYFTDGWQGYDKTSITLYNADIIDYGDKLYAPGGVELTFTLAENEDGTLTLSYAVTGCRHSYTSVTTDATCTAEGNILYTCSECGDSHTEIIPSKGHSYIEGVCDACGHVNPNYVVQPIITVGAPSVSFESEIRYNIYFTAMRLDNVLEMGLILFDTKLSDGTIDNAKEVITGYREENGQYMVQTGGIAPKNMGDALYFRIFAKLTDGSYVYTETRGYNAVVYAKNILQKSTDENMKSLVVAMLNYGAAAQLSFGYRTDSLMNADLTAEQQALVKDYDETMMNDLVSVDPNKMGEFVYNPAGFISRKPSVSFDGDFSINFYFTTAFVPDAYVTIYLWIVDDYGKVQVLTAENASGSGVMSPTGVENQYWVKITEIAAKQVDETIFVAAVYTHNGQSYCTGVLNYSVGAYCEATIAAQGQETGMGPICAGAAVYGYYAKQYFANRVQ